MVNIRIYIDILEYKIYHYLFISLQKRFELNHLNCITRLSDSVLNYLFSNDTNIYNLASVTKSDVLLSYLTSIQLNDVLYSSLYHFSKTDIIISVYINLINDVSIFSLTSLIQMI